MFSKLIVFILILNVHTRSIFKHRQYELVNSRASSDECQFKQNIHKIVEIQNKEDENCDEIMDEFVVFGEKNISDKSIKCCNLCYEKCGLIKKIENLVYKSTLKPTNVENLNCLEIQKRNKEFAYCGCTIEENDYFIAINGNDVSTIRDIVFLINLGDKPKIQRFFDLEIKNFKLKCIHNKIPDVEVTDDLVPIFKSGRSIFTFKNILIAVAAYYVVGILSVVIYYGMSSNVESKMN